mmetsp:Transcript_102226/g.264362  ORF Transcript_102226/g.264362 Transcript_102226/m.264362 type:complete len:217 (+) Transcript_102226:348-998(+)
MRLLAPAGPLRPLPALPPWGRQVPWALQPSAGMVPSFQAPLVPCSRSGSARAKVSRQSKFRRRPLGTLRAPERQLATLDLLTQVCTLPSAALLPLCYSPLCRQRRRGRRRHLRGSTAAVAPEQASSLAPRVRRRLGSLPIRAPKALLEANRSPIRRRRGRTRSAIGKPGQQRRVTLLHGCNERPHRGVRQRGDEVVGGCLLVTLCDYFARCPPLLC